MGTGTGKLQISPSVAWLIAEVTKITLLHIMESGKFDTLTEQEAKDMAAKLTGGLSTNLPSPEELEGPPV